MLPKFSQIVNRLYAFIYETNHSNSGLLPSIVALVMVIDKSWTRLGRHEKAFYTGPKKFVEDCKPLMDSDGNIKCTCKSCRILLWVSIENLSRHITNYGFDLSYKTWIHHGELDLPPPPPVIDNTRQPQMSDMTTCLNDLSYIHMNSDKMSQLKEILAKSGVKTIDVVTGQKFNMRAMVLWTINDFLARSSLSGWSGQGYKACLTYNEDTPSQYLPDEVAKPIIELCSFFKKICSATLIEDDMLKAQSKVVDILCNLEPIYPPAFFDIMIHLVIHFPLEAFEGGPIHSRWMYPFERFMKKLKNYVQNKAKPKGAIKEGYVAEEALTFNKDQGVSATSELFALACGPTPTLISVNSYVVNGVRFVMHNHDERRTSQNNDIFSPDEKDKEIRPSYDLADFDDEDLVNVDDDDDVAVVYSNVAWGHGGDGGGDDRRPPHQVPTGCESCLGIGTRKSNLGGKKTGRLHTSKETRDLGLKKITDVHGPVPIRFEWNDRETLMTLGDHAAHWANYLGELVKELPMYYPSWC
nr:hypothetical protein [Tanacetum cinerariifolium]